MDELINGYTNTPKSLIEAEFLSPNEFRILAVLNSYAFLKKIFPSQEEIANKCNITSVSVCNIIKKLSEKGVLEINPRTTKKGRFSTNEYLFAFGNWNQYYEKKHGKYALEEYPTRTASQEELKRNQKFSFKENKLPYVRTDNALLYTSALNATELRTFLYFRSLIGCEHIYPSYNTITQKTAVSKPVAIKAVTKLGELGLIRKLIQMRDDGGNTSNEYIVANELEIREWLKEQK